MNALTEKEVLLLHEAVFMRSLHALKDSRTKKKTVNEINQWVKQPIVNDKLAGDKPFSFQTCCLVIGVNPVILQNNILQFINNI